MISSAFSHEIYAPCARPPLSVKFTALCCLARPSPVDPSNSLRPSTVGPFPAAANRFMVRADYCVQLIEGRFWAIFVSLNIFVARRKDLCRYQTHHVLSRPRRYIKKRSKPKAALTLKTSLQRRERLLCRDTTRFNSGTPSSTRPNEVVTAGVYLDYAHVR